MADHRMARAGALLLASALLAPAVGAERVKGKVKNHHYLVNPVWNEAKSAKRRYSFREVVPTVPREHRRLYPHIPKELCMVALGSADKEPSGKKVLITVGGGRTTPVTIVVPPKTILQFKNTDPFKHRLYLATKDGQKLFTAKDQAPGGTRDFTVPKAGSFEIRDERAPSLRMWIVGEPKAQAIAYPSLDGEFAITVPEPGTYQLQAFFAGKKVGKPMEVTTNGKDVELKKAIAVAEAPKKKKKSENDAKKKK